ncbi:uncharacterized protein LOC110645728 [Hevea brasiliensis]|uniref:uncharacterized protein LOC110645728 n=1 Tax=Hevea brasiliensis TaxID=3981 RepID=UPI0025E4C727|nr:uncharacterized protein LOC110645728 [Hevea brasiliensis]
MEFDPSEEGSYRPVQEEEIGSHMPIHSQGRDRREESSRGTAGRTQQAFLEQMTQMLCEFTGAIPQPTQRSPLKKLKKYGVVDFMGKKEDDPSATEHWLERIERVLRHLHCTPDQQLECALSLLQEEAYQWWDTVSRMRKLTVFEYEREFVRLGKYAREVMPTEAERCCRFEDRLNDNIRIIVTAHGYTDFSWLVAASLNVERVWNEEQSRRDRQRKRSSGQGQFSTPVSEGKRPKVSQGQSQRQGFQFTQRGGHSRASVESSLGTVVGGSASIPLYTHCERRHRGECRLLTGGCFQCGATDHFLRDCPHRSVSTAPPSTERFAPTIQWGR